MPRLRALTTRPVPARASTGSRLRIGVNVPGQSWTYCNVGPGPSYLEIDQGHAWSASAGRAAAGNLVAIAHTLQAALMSAPVSQRPARHRCPVIQP